MAIQEITVRLPPDVYEHVRRAAAAANRSIDDTVADIVTVAARTATAEPAALRAALSHLPYLNDAALWQLARASTSPEQRDRLEQLHDEQQRRPLTEVERDEEQSLVRLYHTVLA